MIVRLPQLPSLGRSRLRASLIASPSAPSGERAGVREPSPTRDASGARLGAKHQPQPSHRLPRVEPFQEALEFGCAGAGRADTAALCHWATRTSVAQVSNLLYRRLPVCRPFAPPLGRGRVGGLETRDTAGWKSALRLGWLETCEKYALGVFLLGVLLCATGCRRDMFNQPRTKPLRESSFFADGAASRPIPPHTVARGFLEEDRAFYTGMIGTNLVTDFPFPLTRQVLERGRERFEIYCAVCHGRTGEGNGMIPQRGFPAPPSYHQERLRAAPIGHFFDVMTRGYGVMYSYASRVEPADRWAIAAYIRALQLSRNAKLADVPARQRTQLEAMAR